MSPYCLGSSSSKERKVSKDSNTNSDTKKKYTRKIKIRYESAIEEDEEISESAAEDTQLDLIILQRVEEETDFEWNERVRVDDEAREERTRRRASRDERKRRGVLNESKITQDKDGIQEGGIENGGDLKDGIKQVFNLKVCVCVCVCL